MNERLSPLASPRFFDEPALSVWESEGAEGVGSVHTVLDASQGLRTQLKPAARGISRSSPESSAHPIIVEFVKGSGGPYDDKWHVVVDGMRCFPEYENGPVRLPPCVPHDTPYITPDTKARPVAIAVRLEEAAPAPMSVEVKVEQVVHHPGGGVTEDETEVISEVSNLKPYRVSDPVAETVTLAYPFWAHSQSSLGLLDTEPLTLYNEKTRHVTSRNAYAAIKRTVASVDYLVNLRTYRVTGDTFPSQPALPNANLPLPEKSTGLETTHVIGGRDKSAVSEMRDIMENLRYAYSKISKDFRSSSSSESNPAGTRTRAEFMYLLQQFFLTNNDTKTCALFQSLLEPTADPVFKAILTNAKDNIDTVDSILSGNKHLVKSLTHGLVDPSEEEKNRAKAELRKYAEETKLDDNTGIKKGNPATNKRFVLVPHFLFHGARSKWAVSTRIKVTIVDWNGSRSQFLLDAPREDGILAHAIYSDAYNEFRQFDRAATKLIDSFVNVQPYGPSNSFMDSAVRRMQSAAYQSGISKRTQKTAGNYATAKEFVKHVSATASDHSKDFQGAADTNTIVHKIAELRWMMINTLPSWPPLEDNSSIDSKTLEAACAQLQSASESDDTSQRPAYDASLARCQEYLQQQESQTKNAIDLADRYVEAKLARCKESADALDVALYTKSDHKVRRVLPCVPVSAGFVGVRFQNPQRKYVVDIEHWVAVAKDSESWYYSFARTTLKRLMQLSIANFLLAWSEQNVARGFVDIFWKSVRSRNYVQFFSSVFSMWSGASQQPVYSILSILSAFSQSRELWNTIAANLSSFMSSQFKQLPPQTQKNSLKKVIGKPVESAVLSANSAARHLGKQINAMGGGIALLHTSDTQVRISLFEWYVASEATLTKLDQVPPPNGWDRVPLSSAASLLPPKDVAEAMHTWQYIRAVPIASEMQLVSGVAPSVLAPELAAKAAHSELMVAVHAHRRKLRGESLVASAEDVGLDIAKHAAVLVNEVYGSSKSAAVGASDLVWSCARGGAAARLALRHMPVFMDALAGHEALLSSNAYWTGTRRALVKSFAQAWVKEAQAAKASKKKALNSSLLDSVAARAVGAFERVSVMLKKSKRAADDTPLRMIASALVAQIGSDTAAVIARSSGHSVGSTSDYYRRGSQDVPDALMWASRRLHPEFMLRSDKLGDTVPDASSILESLFGKFSICPSGDRGASGSPAELYYCPMGHRLAQAPSADVLSVAGLEARIVSTRAIGDAAGLLLGALRVAAPNATDGTAVVAYRVGAAPDTWIRSIAPHNPLCIAYKQGVIAVPTAYSKGAFVRDKPPDEVYATLLELVAVGREEEVDTVAFCNQISLTRSIAYNAERLFYAIALALATKAAKVDVYLPADSVESARAEVVSLALALALLDGELGAAVPEATVCFGSPQSEGDGGRACLDPAKRTLARLCSQMHAADEADLPACLLAEAAMCVDADG